MKELVKFLYKADSKKIEELIEVLEEVKEIKKQEEDEAFSINKFIEEEF